MQEAFSKFASQTYVIAKNNLVTVTSPQSKTREAPRRYSVERETASELVIRLELDRDDVAIQERFLFSADGESMRWQVADDQVMVFEKIHTTE